MQKHTKQNSKIFHLPNKNKKIKNKIRCVAQEVANIHRSVNYVGRLNKNNPQNNFSRTIRKNISLIAVIWSSLSLDPSVRGYNWSKETFELSDFTPHQRQPNWIGNPRLDNQRQPQWIGKPRLDNLVSFWKATLVTIGW